MTAPRWVRAALDVYLAVPAHRRWRAWAVLVAAGAGALGLTVEATGLMPVVEAVSEALGLAPVE